MTAIDAHVPQYETKRHILRNAFIGLGAVGLVGGATFVSYNVGDWVGHHVIGSGGAIVPDHVAKANALRDYDKALAAASPAGKFTLQFLRRTDYYTEAYPRAHGIAGDFAVSGLQLQTAVGGACLKNTAYDISGGTIRGTISGLFSNGEISGNTPTSAAFAETNPANLNQLIIESGSVNSVNLVFNGLQSNGKLTPANPQTINILNTYGCTGNVPVSTPQIY